MASGVISVQDPILLAADNFTPLTRTPWAGEYLSKTVKKLTLRDKGVNGPFAIGESWEFSCDPQFASKVTLDPQKTLQDLVKAYPKELLSPFLAQLNRENPSCELLVKLLNAKEDLSLQVHPQDDDPMLLANECGKPESWLILHSEPGAGIYLGFSHPLPTQELAKLIATQNTEKIKQALQFVRVRQNDYFEIPPGVPHAIGGGVTLLEPQRVLFGKSGKTYRLWDWGRRYNEKGILDPKGELRPLHAKECLRIMQPETQVGMAFIQTLKRNFDLFYPRDGLEVFAYPPNQYYQTRRVLLSRGANFILRMENSYAALSMLKGSIQLQGQGGTQTQLKCGQPCFLPHAASPLSGRCLEEADFTLICPTSGIINID